MIIESSHCAKVTSIEPSWVYFEVENSGIYRLSRDSFEELPAIGDNFIYSVRWAPSPKTEEK